MQRVKSVSNRSSWHSNTSMIGCTLIFLLSTGCVAPIYLPSNSELDQLSPCLWFYGDINAELRDAGIFNAGNPLVKGVPFLRSSRFLASFAEKAAASDELYKDWLLALNQNAIAQAGLLQGRLDQKNQRHSRLLDCGSKLVADLASKRKWRPLLVKRTRIPTNYRNWRRFVGLYPLAVIPFKWGVVRDQSRFRQQEERYLTQLPDASFQYFGAVSYSLQVNEQPAEEAFTITFPALREKISAFPYLTESDRMALLRAYSPIFALPKLEDGIVADYDSPGTPSAETFDSRKPGIYSYIDFGRFQNQITIRLNYVVWFSERPRKKGLDLLSGDLDSLVWRVHLLPNGGVLAWDTVHSCGCWYRIYPAEGMLIRPSGKFFTEPVYVGKTLLPTTPRKLLYLASGTHHIDAVRDVDRFIKTTSTVRFAPLKSYSELLAQQPPMFDSEGIVKRSKRVERWLFWPMGIISAGAMRASGSQAIAFIGKRHFDDPFLLEEVGLESESRITLKK